MKTILRGFLLASSVLFAGALMADSWVPPSVQAYTSANDAWRLTVYPRELSSQLEYFEDKVAGNSNAGGIEGDTQKSPIGHMEHLDSGQWRTVWKAPLVNDVSPVSALVSDDGATVTLDNWHSIGWGDDAVAIYAADGQLVRKFGLSAFLPKYYIDALPRTVSSLEWSGQASIDEQSRELVIPVVVPTRLSQDSGQDVEVRHVDAHFRLSDGAFAPQSGTAWADAIELAKQADTRRKELEAEARAR